MHLHHRHLVDAQQFEVVEVRLLDGAALDRNRFLQSGGEAVNDRPFDLLGDAVGIDRDATVDRGDDDIQ